MKPRRRGPMVSIHMERGEGKDKNLMFTIVYIYNKTKNKERNSPIESPARYSHVYVEQMRKISV